VQVVIGPFESRAVSFTQLWSPLTWQHVAVTEVHSTREWHFASTAAVSTHMLTE